ncbi:MAG: hypothetical protein ACXV8Q_20265 [Methylobacter sp.]
MNIFLCHHHHAAKLVHHTFLISAVGLFCYSANVPAQSTEAQELKLEVETLKKRIQELQSSNPAKVPSVKTRKSDGNPWHSLQVNMSKTEVNSLLGKPGKVDKWKTGEAWYFPNPRGGEVDFDANGNVSGWLEP